MFRKNKQKATKGTFLGFIFWEPFFVQNFVPVHLLDVGIFHRISETVKLTDGDKKSVASQLNSKLLRFILWKPCISIKTSIHQKVVKGSPWISIQLMLRHFNVETDQ